MRVIVIDHWGELKDLPFPVVPRIGEWIMVGEEVYVVTNVIWGKDVKVQVRIL